MPTVHNGIGTWYYGKQRIHSRKGTCEFCGRLATLESYDTTLFFVFFMVPLIPLSRKRILEDCSVCRQHRVVPLKKWQEAKLEKGAEVLDQLREQPNNREYILEAIVFAHAYQDEPLLNEVIVPLVADRTDDAVIQFQLGVAYAYFARWPQAEQAYRESLAVEDKEGPREGLGWALLKQGRPREARPYFQHILDKKDTQGAGNIYYLVEGYQTEGLHDEALALMDERDAAFADLAETTEYRKQRKLSTRYKGTQKRVSSSLLKEGSKAGYRQGNWTAALPRFIAAGIFLAAIGAYLGSAIWIGQARKVFLLNGTNSPYTVSLRGQEHTLPPGTPTPVRIAEGDVEITFADAKLGLEPEHCRIETGFWGRPFTNPTIVINPDRWAILLEQEAWYAERNPPPNAPEEIHVGKVAYQFSGIDYEFKEFPKSITISKNAEVRKTRVGLATGVTPGARLVLVAQRFQGEGEKQIDLCKRLLRLDPHNDFLIRFLATKLPANEMLEFFKVHLDKRPPLVDWHRAYQDFMEDKQPGVDQRGRYQQMLVDTKEHPDALYLFARIIEDRAKGNELLRKAATAAPPSAHAMSALGYAAFSDGRFAEAVTWFDKASPLLPDNTSLLMIRPDVLLANKEYDRLLRDIQALPPPKEQHDLIEIMRINAIRGDKEKAKAALDEAVQMSPADQQQKMRNSLKAMLRTFEGDRVGYLKAIEAIGLPSFENNFLKGKLDECGAFINANDPEAGARHALIYLAATRAGKKELAETHWKKLGDSLTKGQRDERILGDILAGRKTAKEYPPKQLLIDPKSKRVYLALLAERFPEQAKELLPLARTLDFHRDGLSLCLRQVLDKK